ncbi:MAG: 50S ribosomal protein L10 [Candidatus Hydrothermarchaeales archaeon]
MAHVAEWKKQEVEDLKKLIVSHSVVGVVDMENIPAKQLQKMRELLRSQVLIKMSKKSLMKLGLEKASKEKNKVDALEEHLVGQPAFIFSDINPFKIYKTLEKNKTSALAKPDSIAPVDIIVPKGDTPFPPGPMLGELQQAGIPATIQGGKITIKDDKVVVKKGERINDKLAMALAKLEIEPMEVGLDMLAVYEDGNIYTPDVLAIDEDETRSNIQTAYQQAFNLSLNSGYITRATAPAAIAKAVGEARNLAINATIFEAEVIDIILAKAQSQALAVDSALGDSVEKKLGEIKVKEAEAVPKKAKEKPAKEEAEKEEAKPKKKPAEKKKASKPKAAKKEETEKKAKKPEEKVVKKAKEQPSKKAEKAKKKPEKKEAKKTKKK